MKRKLGARNSIFFIILWFLGVFSPPLISIAGEFKDNSSIIEDDYLYKKGSIDYILGSGDKFTLIISRDYPELTSTVEIDGEGMIYLQKLGRVYVAGLSIDELTKILNTKLLEYIKFPEVEIIINFYRPVKVFVKGEVENPKVNILKGSLKVDNSNLGVSYSNDLSLIKGSNISNDNINYFFPTVFDAIRNSGGITNYSDLSKVKVIRINNLSKGGGKISTVIDFSEHLFKGNNNKNLRIYDGDIIFIPKLKEPQENLLNKAVSAQLNKRIIKVFVTGRVNNPGNLEVSRSSSLNDAIDIAGGTKVLNGHVRFVRINNDGLIEKRKIKYRARNKRDSYSNPILREGDLIFVGESLFSLSADVITELTSPFVGIFSTYGLIKALEN